MKITAAFLISCLLACSRPQLIAAPPAASLRVTGNNVVAVATAEESTTESQGSGEVAPGTKPMVEISFFTEAYVTPLIDKLKEFDAQGHEEIIIRINTYGGSVHWGMQLIQAMEQLKAKRTCVVDWRAMSMGAFLLESHACTTRMATSRSLILFHEPLLTEAGGNSHQLRDSVEYLEALTDALVSYVSRRIKMNEKKFRAKISNRNWTMSGSEALRHNVVDKIIDPSELPPLIEVKPLKTFRIMFSD